MIRRVLPFAMYGMGQLAAQGFSFAASVLVINSLPKSDYALYAVTFGVLSAASLVADGGVNAALLSRGAKLTIDSPEFRGLFLAGIRFRKNFGVIITLLALLWLTYLLLESGASGQTILLMSSILVATFTVQIGSTVYQALHRVKLDAKRLRKVAVEASVIRLVGALFITFTGQGSVEWFALVALSAVCWTYLRFRFGTELGHDNKAVNAKIFWPSTKRVLPMTLLLVAAEQATIAIVTVRAGPEVLAEFSAVSRFGVAYVIVNAVVSDLVAPRFARAPNARGPIGRALFVVSAAYWGGILALMIVVVVFSDAILALLGPNYSGLNSALLIACLGFGVANFGHALNSMNNARIWLKGSWLIFPLTAMWFGWSAFLAPMENSSDAAIVFLGQTGAWLLTQLLRLALGIRASGST